ncbi:iron chelate uptake ABC transporter family permease subunit [Okibacterium endophyticum]
MTFPDGGARRNGPRRPERSHGGRVRLLGIVVALVVLAVVVWASLALGTRDVGIGAVIQALADPQLGNNDHLVIRELRVPRTLVGLAVGCALGLAGTVMQGITRNPLADPGLLGVNAGASLSVVLAITLLGITSPAGYIWFALGGAALAAALVYAIGTLSREGSSPVTLALAGTAVTAGLTSVITLVLLSGSGTLTTYRFWAVGSLASRDLGTLTALLPFLLIGAVLAAFSGRMLNLLSLGDDLARGLGQSIVISRIVSGLAVVLLCGAATALAGPMVFVGLVVPHLCRAFTGPDHRWILAWSAVVGPILLLSADVVGRLIVPPGELEAGIVVALLGAPAMIALVRRVKTGGL